MIPADLLARLQEADPGLWEKIAETALSEYEYHDEEFNAWISNAITYTDLFGPAQEAWLQHCLQAAIRTRVGWGYQITAFGLPIIACVYNRRDYITARGESEAEALGWAYLAVIEAIRP